MDHARRFASKSILVTGASSGIGEAVARAFAREGGRVGIVGRRKERLLALAEEVALSGGFAALLQADLSDLAGLASLVDRARTALGGVDILVNAAGVNHRGPIDRWSPEELVEIVTLNLTVPITLARLLLPDMKNRGGAIVSVASLAGRIPLRGEAVYSATKFALRTFSFALAEEVAEANVRVSVVSPGPVDSDFIRRDIAAIPDVVFAQPMTSPARVAEMVLDCASDGRPERATPRSSAILATVGYLFPSVRRALSVLMEPRGARAKQAYLRAHQPSDE